MYIIHKNGAQHIMNVTNNKNGTQYILYITINKNGAHTHNEHHTQLEWGAQYIMYIKNK